MNWVQSIKHQHSVKTFRKKAGKVSFPREFVDFDQAETFGFILNIEQIHPDELVHFTKYITQLEDKGKKVIVVELNFQKKASPMFVGNVNAIFIGQPHINWLGFPVDEKLRELNEAHCDILFNLDTAEKMTSRYICGLCNARMRVGIHEEEQESFYELMFQIGEDQRLKTVLKAFETYAKMLQK